MRCVRVIMALTAAVVLPVVMPTAALAHGFGERYDLPVPLSLYIAGAGAVVLLSFVVVALSPGGLFGADYPRVNMLRWWWGRWLASRPALLLIRVCAVALFVLYLVAGLWGTSDPNRNLVPTMTWVVFWVGLVYVNGFVGNLWALVNPWNTIFQWAEALWTRITGKPLNRRTPYPERLGMWPGVALFLVFAWVENVWPDAAVPSRVAALTLAYTAVTFAGMFVYGRGTWLRYGEAFSIAMAFFARFAPTEVRVAGNAPDDYEVFATTPPEGREWNLRPWGSGLIAGPQLTLSASAFLILMLATVSFDGFGETPAWATFATGVHGSFAWLGANAFTGIETLGLLLAPLVLLGVFAVAVRFMRALGRSDQPLEALIGVFAVSLVPIALGYHVAHFLSFLLIQGQRVIPLASDPLGQGWDILGTASYTLDIGIIDARTAWVAGLVAIVAGHVSAVMAAHVIAGRVFGSRRLALRSQYAMTALMVGYTMLSLWITAQPIVAH